jgi:Uma2 family endonuclease
MAMPALLPERSIWTVADLADLPSDGARYELLHGELIVASLPMPLHQRVVMKLASIFERAEAVGPGCTVLAPAEIHISTATMLEPDLAVYAGRNAAGVDWRTMPRPMLVVEVLSPSTRKHDRHRKRPEYLALGIPEVWTVDLDAREIERWTAASEFPSVERTDFDFALSSAHPLVRVAFDTVFGGLPS